MEQDPDLAYPSYNEYIFSILWQFVYYWGIILYLMKGSSLALILESWK